MLVSIFCPKSFPINQFLSVVIKFPGTVFRLFRYTHTRDDFALIVF